MPEVVSGDYIIRNRKFIGHEPITLVTVPFVTELGRGVERSRNAFSPTSDTQLRIADLNL
jgi:hypothetical protein